MTCTKCEASSLYVAIEVPELHRESVDAAGRKEVHHRPRARLCIPCYDVMFPRTPVAEARAVLA